MNVTDVRIRKIRDEGRMRAVVSVTFDDAFVVHDIKIIEGQNGLFVAMPSRRVGDSDYRDIAHPIHQQMRNELAEVVFSEYEKALMEEEPSAEVVSIEDRTSEDVSKGDLQTAM